MSALRPDTTPTARETSEAPYPSWPDMADSLTSCRSMPDQGIQTLKEARIWQALADEQSAEEQAPPDLERM